MAQVYFGHVVREERGMENARGDELEEKEGKANNNMAGHINNIKGPFSNSKRLDARDGAKWRSATAVVASGWTRLDGIW